MHTCQDLAGSQEAQCELSGCGCKGSVIKWFSGSEEGVVAQVRQRLRGNNGLQVKSKDKARV